MHKKNSRFTLRASPVLRLGILAIFLCSGVPAEVFGSESTHPYEQDFIVTGYYSPLPGQCCYVRGGYEADKVLNGEGERGADGTKVYPGMAAASASFAFNTRIRLAVGTVEVHDRGGAIQELDGGVQRLDIWMGYGEEGLARALAFGVRHMKGTVYPVGGAQDASFDLEAVPFDVNQLSTYLVTRQDLLDVQPKFGDQSYSTSLLQNALKDAGYFHQSVTGPMRPAPGSVHEETSLLSRWNLKMVSARFLSNFPLVLPL